MAIDNVSNDNDILTVITDAHCRCSQYLQINRKNSWHLKNRTTKTTFCFWLYVYNNCIQQYAKLGICDNSCGLSPVTLPLNSVSKLHCHFTPELSRIRMNLDNNNKRRLVLARLQIYKVKINSYKTSKSIRSYIKVTSPLIIIILIIINKILQRLIRLSFCYLNLFNFII